MGDTTDGSSSAARGAQTSEADTERSTGQKNDQDTDQSDDDNRGFFSRIFNALSPTEDGETASGSTQMRNGAETLGMLNLSRKVVEDVAIPKADIVSVPSTITKDELVQVFRDSGLSRLPVYKGTLDTPLGMVHLKDFALKHGFNGAGGRFSLKKLLRPMFYVPASMTIGVLLAKMQAERRHMALVIDEYGGVDGLLTIEDLIEQVVGEIEDEHDIDEGRALREEKPGQFVTLAKTKLDDFYDATGFDLADHDEVDEEEIDTLGGLVFMMLGRVPVRGEVIEHPSGAMIEVIEADPRRIKRLRVRLPGFANG